MQVVRLRVVPRQAGRLPGGLPLRRLHRPVLAAVHAGAGPVRRGPAAPDAAPGRLHGQPARPGQAVRLLRQGVACPPIHVRGGSCCQVVMPTVGGDKVVGHNRVCVLAQPAGHDVVKLTLARRHDVKGVVLRLAKCCHAVKLNQVTGIPLSCPNSPEPVFAEVVVSPQGPLVPPPAAPAPCPAYHHFPLAIAPLPMAAPPAPVIRTGTSMPSVVPLPPMPAPARGGGHGPPAPGDAAHGGQQAGGRPPRQAGHPGADHREERQEAAEDDVRRLQHPGGAAGDRRPRHRADLPGRRQEVRPRQGDEVEGVGRRGRD